MKDLVNLFRGLSDGTRLRILELLQKGELSVSGIASALNAMQPRISFHLAALKSAGFVKNRREGRSVYYRIEESDFFRRVLLLSVLEKVSGGRIEEDRWRLERVPKIKEQATSGKRRYPATAG